jgi:predicted GNAT family acetyltransferase
MTTEVTRTPGRYEIHVDGTLAGYAEYHEDEGALAFPHTVVEDAFEGQGLGSELVRGALDDVRSQGRLIHPFCPYVRSWIGKHPEYRDLVEDPERFDL